MKKLFLAALCAGLFFACGNKKQAEQPETLIDTPVAQQPMVEPEQQVAEPVADEPVAQTTPAKKQNTTTTNAKPNKTNAETGMSAKKEGTQSVKEHAEEAGNRIANKAIDKAESEATSTIVNSGKKKR